MAESTEGEAVGLETPELLQEPAATTAASNGAEELARAFEDPAAPEVDRGPTPEVDRGRVPEPTGAAKPWSKTKLKEATRKDMQSRIRELETIAASTPQPHAAPGSTPEVAADPAVLEAQTRTALAGTFGVVSNLGARLRGEHWRLSSDEAAKLADVWAPVLTPHLGTLAQYLPLGVAIATTAEVVWPRIEADMRRAKVGAAEPLPVKVEPAAEA